MQPILDGLTWEKSMDHVRALAALRRLERLIDASVQAPHLITPIRQPFRTATVMSDSIRSLLSMISIFCLRIGASPLDGLDLTAIGESCRRKQRRIGAREG